jgi:hypothetical protein
VTKGITSLSGAFVAIKADIHHDCMLTAIGHPDCHSNGKDAPILLKNSALIAAFTV